jgi:hypothetical protein
MHGACTAAPQPRFPRTPWQVSHLQTVLGEAEAEVRAAGAAADEAHERFLKERAVRRKLHEQLQVRGGRYTGGAPVPQLRCTSAACRRRRLAGCRPLCPKRSTHEAPAVPLKPRSALPPPPPRCCAATSASSCACARRSRQARAAPSASHSRACSGWPTAPACAPASLSLTRSSCGTSARPRCLRRWGRGRGRARGYCTRAPLRRVQHCGGRTEPSRHLPPSLATLTRRPLQRCCRSCAPAPTATTHASSRMARRAAARRTRWPGRLRTPASTRVRCRQARPSARLGGPSTWPAAVGAAPAPRPGALPHPPPCPGLPPRLFLPPRAAPPPGAVPHRSGGARPRLGLQRRGAGNLHGRRARPPGAGGSRLWWRGRRQRPCAGRGRARAVHRGRVGAWGGRAAGGDGQVRARGGHGHLAGGLERSGCEVTALALPSCPSIHMPPYAHQRPPPSRPPGSRASCGGECPRPRRCRTRCATAAACAAPQRRRSTRPAAAATRWCRSRCRRCWRGGPPP